MFFFLLKYILTNTFVQIFLIDDQQILSCHLCYFIIAILCYDMKFWTLY